MEVEYYAPWEWQPIERMVNGCVEVMVRDNEGNITELCSCDYWWLTPEKKKKFTTFRFS